ncbi:hypothetical protein D9611_011077 [Ephemerocybe angulata]|uniref:Uncharacterized protein n=1 Tax=Ephemerocybe angulata TaxID=980116 RepID=A0A8H5BBQ8_9AGAR|nr:hypothetical protein D9611_011077 [Tulosesus angulatus]
MDIALKKTPNPLGIVEMIESRSTPSAQLLGVAKLQMVGVTFTMGSEGLDATDTLWNPRSPQILHDAVKRLKALALQEGVTDPSPNNPWPQVFRVTSQVHSEFYPMVEGCGDYVYLNTALPEPDKVRLLSILRMFIRCAGQSF